jgi:hypothetical protein
VFTFAGYILGFPADTRESILRDVEIIKRELPLDVLEFFFLTPLPGSQDHKDLYLAGTWMDPDLNKYNLNTRVTHHSAMSDADWEAAYREAWASYFTWDHMETVVRRHAILPRGRPKKAAQYMNEFKMMFEIERLHPLEGGIVRRKRRRSRRAGFRRVPALVFYPAFALECVGKAWRYWRYLRTEKKIVKRVCADPTRRDYMDMALTEATEDELETMGLFQETRGGIAAVEKKHRQDALLESVRAGHAGAAA